ncbi:hypothetical protein F4678DRAFT_460462 [Xylaria arbuscula]|nr:hypothetical protein F4678DRAFT_460462 [Xylaria arbuscula]
MAVSKLSVADDLPADEDKIIIFLSPRGPSEFPQRRLVLTRRSPVVAIGRSSKVKSKGFIPAVDNAWFDNPVVSRQHAEIIAEFNEKPWTVYLKDANSFHGTFHRASNGRDNERRLKPREPVKLEIDDIIRFGVDIFRANQTFPPCSVIFKMESATQKSNDLPRRGFTVPDDIDDEEDEYEPEGYSVDTAFHTKPNPNNPEFISNNSRLPLIDLTVDDDLPRCNDLPLCTKSPVSSTVENFKISSDVIDLTSEPNYESDEEADVEACTVAPHRQGSCGIGVSTSAPVSSEGPPSLQSRLEIIKFSSARDTSVPKSTITSDDEETWHVYHDEELSDDYSESEISQADTSKSDSSLVSTADPDDFSDVEPSNPDTTLPEFEAENWAPNNWEDENDDDNLSTISDSECRDGCSSGDEEQDDEDENEDEAEDDDEEEENEDDALTEPSSDLSAIKMATSLSQVVDSQSHCEITAVPPLSRSVQIPKPIIPCDLPHSRDPSPSDAALFKRRPQLDNVPNNSRAQQLGEKTGKFEFFAAREQNRIAAVAQNSPAPISAIRETLQVARPDDIFDDVNSVIRNIINSARNPSPSLSCAPEVEVIAPRDDGNKATILPTGFNAEDEVLQDFSFPEAPDTTSIKLGDTDTNQYSAWTASGDQFINNPPEDLPEPSVIRLGPADLDMTSAYKFQQSKLSTAQNDFKIRRLFIHDLLAQEPKQCAIIKKQAMGDLEMVAPETTRTLPTSSTSAPTKRSYEEAFNQPEDDYTNTFQNDSPSSQAANAKDQTSASSDDIDTTATQSIMSAENIIGMKGPDVSAVIPVEPEFSRPTKRMRLAVAVKVAACVALGSAATFSYLVNTAPVF